jgi:hypothetical protein
LSTGGALGVKSLRDYYSVKAAAREIGIEYMALHQRIHRGSVEVERPGDRIVLISRTEVERLKKELMGE